MMVSEIGFQGGNMNRRIAIALGALVVACGLLLYAQESGGTQTGVAQVGFVFDAGGKTLQPGSYTVNMPDQDTVLLRGPNASQAVCPVFTRLGRLNEKPTFQLVFDVLNDKSTLSEVWFTTGDGFLVSYIKGPHTHKMVTGK